VTPVAGTRRTNTSFRTMTRPMRTAGCATVLQSGHDSP
jgi:hypothetical protein